MPRKATSEAVWPSDGLVDTMLVGLLAASVSVAAPPVGTLAPADDPCVALCTCDRQPPSDWEFHSCDLQLQNHKCIERQKLKDGICSMSCKFCKPTQPDLSQEAADAQNTAPDGQTWFDPSTVPDPQSDAPPTKPPPAHYSRPTPDDT